MRAKLVFLFERPIIEVEKLDYSREKFISAVYIKYDVFYSVDKTETNLNV